jgi:hypothetical protein
MYVLGYAFWYKTDLIERMLECVNKKMRLQNIRNTYCLWKSCTHENIVKSRTTHTKLYNCIYNSLDTPPLYTQHLDCSSNLDQVCSRYCYDFS